MDTGQTGQAGQTGQEPTTDWHSAIGKDGAFTENFKNVLPEDIRESAFFGKHKTVGELAKAAVNLEKMMGGRIKIPTADAPQHEVEDYYKKIGRPDTPDGYEFKFEGIPEDYPVNQDTWKVVAQIAHKHGIPKQALESVYKEILENDIKQYSSWKSNQAIEADNAKKESVANLAKTWGTVEGSQTFNERNNIVNQFLKSKGVESMAQNMDPAFRTMVYEMAKQTSEGRMIGGSGSDMFTAGEAKAKYQQAVLKYNDPNTPATERAMWKNESTKYYKMLNQS